MKWDMTKLPPGKIATGSQWVFKIKYHENGTIKIYITRLVTLGNKKIVSVDYKDTFTHVIKISLVCILFQIASARGWKLHQMDVHNAFLHINLKEEVYMRPPLWFGSSDHDLVCCLKKSLFGLRHAHKCWLSKLCTTLITYRFVQSKYNYYMFSLRKSTGSEIYILVYVDDFFIGGNDHDVTIHFKRYLRYYFHMKDLGFMKYFWGWK